MPYRYVALHMKRLRERRLMTQAELAEELGVDTRTVQRIESGETRPSKRTMRALSEVFALSPGALQQPPVEDLHDDPFAQTPASESSRLAALWTPPGSFANPEACGTTMFDDRFIDVKVRACPDAARLVDNFTTSEFFRVVPKVELNEAQIKICDGLDSSVSDGFFYWETWNDDERKLWGATMQGHLEALEEVRLRLAFERVDIDMISLSKRLRREASLLVMTVIDVGETERKLQVIAEVWARLRKCPPDTRGKGKDVLYWHIRRRSRSEAT